MKLFKLLSVGLLMASAAYSVQANDEHKSDAKFLHEMIEHHQSGIQMAQMAQEKATRSDVRQLADNIISDQKREIADMQRELDRLEGSKHNHDQHAAHGDSMMKKLEKADRGEFDRVFLKEMIDHHRSAVRMSEPVAKRRKNDTVRDFAQNIIRKQNAEIEQMQDMLKKS